MPSRTVVNIQGLTSIYAKHYYANLPSKVLRKFAISNLVRGNVIQQRKRLEKRSLFEIETIQRVEHVIGRTDWDRACTMQINPGAIYHFCNESLRDEFYKHNWDINNCERYLIFMSQSSAPYKGLHFMLEAMPEIIQRFSKTHLYVAGNNPTNADGIYNKIKISSYGKYISELIRDCGLVDRVTFIGNLSEVQMCDRFLQSHVFVSASTIENSPNSVGEAMILGVPVVASDVGGVKNLMKHNEDGFTYQHDATYMLAYYVCEIFGSNDLAIKFSQNAKAHAQKTHDREKNVNTLIRIYKAINLS
jgi:glycosyltransferase involved in cell wall biosynthesis